MPVEPDQRGSIPEALSHQFQQAEDPVAIAGELVRIVQDIEVILEPLLGVRGVAALYQRSLHLARIRHPWLTDPVEIAQPTIDLAALPAAFAREGRAEAAVGALAVLQSFHDLLASLIGHALSTRLLDPVWARHSGRHAVQDTEQ